MQTFITRWVLGHKITPHQISTNCDLVTVETPAQTPGPPPHLHNSFTESFIVIEGELEFIIDGETKILRAGESIEIPPGTTHTFHNKSDSPCKWIDIHSPKGFLDFFSQIGIPAQQSNALEKSVAPDLIEKVVKTAPDFDMIIG